MPASREKIWYASYGSNLSAERFMVYISGGKAPNSDHIQPGCTEKTKPSSISPITLSHELYFAGWAPQIYGGGTAGAFLRLSRGGSTLGRAYLIGRDQFEDVIKQENSYGRSDTSGLTVDVDTAISNGHSSMTLQAPHDELIYCGDKDGYPVLSFTHSSELEFVGPPSFQYLQMIANGLREAHGLDAVASADYFKDKAGIIGHFTLDRLVQALV